MCCGESLEGVTQRSCGCPIPGGLKALDGVGPARLPPRDPTTGHRAASRRRGALPPHRSPPEAPEPVALETGHGGTLTRPGQGHRPPSSQRCGGKPRRPDPFAAPAAGLYRRGVAPGGAVQASARGSSPHLAAASMLAGSPGVWAHRGAPLAAQGVSARSRSGCKVGLQVLEARWSQSRC